MTTGEKGVAGFAPHGNGGSLLRSLERFGEKPGLARIEFLLDKLGRPQQRFPAVHIAGTNGKGSTAAMIAAVLQGAGRRVGLFTSPHLLHYNERIVVDGEPIADDELGKLLDAVAPHVAEAAATPEVGQPTEFEVATAVALAHFAAEAVDVAVVEVGLGGRLDSTNVVRPVVSVITPIDLDHTGVLGTDLAAIAAEKAGIIRSGVPVIVGKQPPEAARILQERARQLGAPLYEQGVDFDGIPVALDRTGTVFDLQLSGFGTLPVPVKACSGLHLKDVHISLVGAHQAENAAVAAATALAAEGVMASEGVLDATTTPNRTFCPDTIESVLRSGLATARWPGRFEVVDDTPLTIVDGAHNAASARALARIVETVFKGERIVFVLGVLAEKSPEAILTPLLPLADAVVFTRPSQGRTAPADPTALLDVARAWAQRCEVPVAAPPDDAGGGGLNLEIVDRPLEAVDRARERAGKAGVVIVAGSLYLVGEVKSFLQGIAETLGNEQVRRFPREGGPHGG